MKGIEEMDFSCEPDRNGKYVGRVAEFPKLHTRPHTKMLDALDEIITLTSEQLREIDSSREQAKR